MGRRVSFSNRRKTSRVLLINIYTIIVYLVIQGIVALALKLLPDILASNNTLRESDLFYEAYNIGIIVLIVLIYLLWGYLQGKSLYNYSSIKRVLSFSIVTIGNTLFILYLYILSMNATEGSGELVWVTYFMVNIGYMPIMNFFSSFESIPYLSYIGYFIVAFIPIFAMVFGTELRIKRIGRSKRLF